MTIRAVVFDIGGVLEYTPDEAQGRASKKWTVLLGLDEEALFSGPMLPLWTGGSLGKCTEQDIMNGLREHIGMTPEQIDGLWADIWLDYLGSPNTELMTYFSNLRPKYRTAILSNSFVGAREREQAAYGFEDMVEFIIYSHEVGLQKPDPAVFQLLCDRLNLPPAEIVYLDDVDVHVNAARAHGIHAVQFIENSQAIAEIEAILQTA
jgi:epoxide hydrolase-like predicted phosphatase